MSVTSSDAAHYDCWRLDALTWSEHNTEAFAGLHNVNKRLIVLFDESSSISDKVWETTEGALTDANTEIIWIAFGNYTRNTGRFHDCFTRDRHRWINKQIDSRDVEGTNKEQLNQWVTDHGEDSDFVRVRVRGIAPKYGISQLISTESLDRCMIHKTTFEFLRVTRELLLLTWLKGACAKL